MLLQQPRMLARVADHDLILPPARFMRDAEKLVEWAAAVDYAGADGVVVSLDAIAGNSENHQRLLGSLLKGIRAARRGIPIYGFASDSPDRLVEAALGLVAGSELDYLLVAGQRPTNSAYNRDSLANQIAERGLSAKVAISAEADAAAMVMLSRMLNRRFGFSPKILPIYASEEGRRAAVSGLPLQSEVSAMIEAAGGLEVAQSGGSAREVDLLLFVHTPRAPARNRAVLVEAIAASVRRGASVALADISESKDAKEELIAELRRLKLMDKVIAYASSTPGGAGGGYPADAIHRAATHASAFLDAIRFLRGDLERVRRFDRAHFNLLFSRYLGDWAYALTVRPQLDLYVREQLKADPRSLGENIERAEAFAFEKTREIADQLFNEQFKRNIHAILLSTGERVQFEISMLQRLQVRLASGDTSEAEIRQSVYIPQLNLPLLPQNLAQARWFLGDNAPDDRIVQRFLDTNWSRFKTDAEEVEISVKIQPQQNPSASYTINCDRKRNTRRIAISAPSVQGAYYALGKLESMGAAGQLAADFQITESPSIALRGVVEDLRATGWSHGDRLEMIRFLGRVRMNRYVYSPDGGSRNGNFTESESERFRRMLEVAEENFVDVVYAATLPASSGAARDLELAGTIRELDEAAALGARSFALRLPASKSAGDGARFKALAQSHAGMVSRVYSHLKTSRGDANLWVVPAPDADAVGDDEYLKNLAAAIPAEVSILATVSRIRESGFTGDRRLIVLEGPVAAGEKTFRMLPVALHALSPAAGGSAAGFVVRVAGGARVSMPAIATAADYAWDPRSYDRQHALDRALGILYDNRARPGVKIWLQVFGDGAPNVFDPLFQEGSGEIDVVSMEQRLAELQRALESIGSNLEQGLLRGELAQFIAGARSAIERLKIDRSYEKLPGGSYRLRGNPE
jgi:hypothetical protein